MKIGGKEEGKRKKRTTNNSGSASDNSDSNNSSDCSESSNSDNKDTTEKIQQIKSRLLREEFLAGSTRSSRTQSALCTDMVLEGLHEKSSRGRRKKTYVNAAPRTKRKIIKEAEYFLKTVGGSSEDMNDEGNDYEGAVQICAAIIRRRGVKVEKYIEEVNNLDEITKAFDVYDVENDNIWKEIEADDTSSASPSTSSYDVADASRGAKRILLDLTACPETKIHDDAGTEIKIEDGDKRKLTLTEFDLIKKSIIEKRRVYSEDEKRFAVNFISLQIKLLECDAIGYDTNGDLIRMNWRDMRTR
jgi:hypothetical protein